MDFTAEFRKTYLGAAPHTLVTSLIWITGGLLGQFDTKGHAIIFFIIAGTFTFPLGELVRKLIKAPELVSKENRLSLLFMLLAFTIPLSYPLIYLACKNDVNQFFPAFSILVGAHYLPFVYGYGMPVFGIMAALLVSEGVICSLWYSQYFSLSAFITGIILLLFGIINYHRVKKEIV